MTAQELKEDYSVQRALQYGLLPSVFSHDDPKKYLSSYIQAYLKEEVQQEGLARNLSAFILFLETASFSQGEVLSYTEIAREIAITRHTVSNFFDVLEDLLIAYRLPVFSKRAKREVISHPKFYYFDTGVFQSIRPRGPLDINKEIDGPALETLFLQEARAINDYLELGYKFFFWRTRSKVEVDFILYGENGLHAFEIKRSDKLSRKDFKGLRLFKEDYPMSSLHMLYGGSNSYFEGDIEVVPFVDAIKTLPSILRGKSAVIKRI